MTYLLAMWIGGALAAWLMLISEETTSGALPIPKELAIMLVICFAWPVSLPFGIFLDLKE